MTYENLLREDNVPIWNCPEDGAFVFVYSEDMTYIYFKPCPSCATRWRWRRGARDWEVTE